MEILRADPCGTLSLSLSNRPCPVLSHRLPLYLGDELSGEEEGEDEGLGLGRARPVPGQRTTKYLIHLRYNDLLNTLPDVVTIRPAGRRS